MSVGQAIAERTGLRLFHNHISIELALRYFDYGTPAFHRLSSEIRRAAIEEVAASDLPGLVFGREVRRAPGLPAHQQHAPGTGRGCRAGDRALRSDARLADQLDQVLGPACR
jgi:hypothetical protein